MPKFRYEAEDDRGILRSGEVESGSAGEAERLLRGRGLRALRVEAVAPHPTAPESAGVDPASGGEGEAVLAEGLRAAAVQWRSGRVARALRRLSKRIAGGQSLEQALAAEARRGPRYLIGLIRAAARTGRLGAALDELLEHRRMRQAAWGRLLGALIYPALVLALTLAIFLVALCWVVPAFKEMFEDFQLDLPAVTASLIRCSDAVRFALGGSGIWMLGGLVGSLTAAGVFGPRLIGPARTGRLVASIPIFGPLWHWTTAAAFARLLAVLVDHGLPLPEALRAASEALPDANTRDLALRLAEGVEQGRRLSDLLAESDRLPASLVPLVRWGERAGALAEALRAADTMFLQRVVAHTSFLPTILPPIVFLFVAFCVAFAMAALLAPMLLIIRGWW